MDILQKVELVAPVPNEELLARTMSHDVGLALEQPYCPNKMLTASNKIFEYLRAGLAVIATRTAGQEEVFRKTTDIGVLVRPGDTAALAAAMQRFIDDPATLKSARNASTTAGSEVWAWEMHSGRVVGAVVDALSA